MNLHFTVAGKGPRLLLLHGWALNSHVWDDIVPELAGTMSVECVDLPGHGASPWGSGFDSLATLAQAVAPHVAGGAIVLGWSLGALVALQLAITRPQDIRALILVAGTARFLQADDEPGVEPSVLNSFAQHLQMDYERTVREFLALQVRGDEHAHATLRVLRRNVLAVGAPDVRALAAGLEVLRTADLSDQLSRVRAPALVIAGERDRLTPPEASQTLASRLPRARFHLVPGAAHAPFLSHSEEFLHEIRSFLARMTLQVVAK